MSLPERVAVTLDRTAREKQHAWRVPGLLAAVVQGGEVAWWTGVGSADVAVPDTAPDPGTAFAIGSITKTFTATLVMRMRDAGALSLQDPLGKYLPELATRHADLPIRELLSHASGLQREPASDIWDSLEIPSIDGLIADAAQAERVLPSRRRWHYSNLAFALLGEVAARCAGTSWFDAVHAQLLQPLGMTGTALQPPDGRAIGYYVDPFADRVKAEPWPDPAGFAAAGGLWSTATDLAKWAQFLAAGDDSVLAESTVEEMARPEIMADLEGWTLAWGLGLELARVGERVLVGHGGAMPGFLSGILVRRSDRTAAIVLCNSSADAAPVTLAGQLVATVLDELPAVKKTWRPGPAVAIELEPVLGRWWSEGEPYAFSVRNGALEARLEADPAGKAPAVFIRIDTDLYRGVSGREEGELLRLQRRADGSVERLLWATYPVTREPEVFGG
ncbi:MAG: serine hydrolase domain-containing protein [Jatrophihabitans sp.]